jgi:hypothetical protein
MLICLDLAESRYLELDTELGPFLSHVVKDWRPDELEPRVMFSFE